MNCDTPQNPDDTSEKIRLLLLKLPKSLPSIKRSATAEGEQIEQGYSLKDLPPGQMGKMRVYKSGAVKLKLGETQYDVSISKNFCLILNRIIRIFIMASPLFSLLHDILLLYMIVNIFCYMALYT